MQNLTAVRQLPKIMSQQLWIKVDGDVRGPYSASELRNLVRTGKLKASHQVTQDGAHWVEARSVKGLDFPELDSPFDLTTPSAPGLGNDVFGLLDELPASSPTPAAPPAPPSPFAAAGYVAVSAAASLQGGFIPANTRSVTIKQKREGALWGCLLALALLCVVGMFVAVLASVVGESKQAEAFVAVVFMVLLLVPLSAFIVAFVGTSMKVSLGSLGSGMALCTIVKRIAFVPVFRRQLSLDSTDYLVKNVKRMAYSKAQVDRAMLIIAICLLFAGGFPGIIFWISWLRSRNMADTGATVSLALVARHPRPIPLFKQMVNDYYGTRFGDPCEVVALARLFENAASIRTLSQGDVAF